MNFDSLLKIFVPKDHSFYPLFEKDAKCLVQASKLMIQLISTDDHDLRDPLIREIKEVELEGDRLTNQIFNQLNKSFITPFDREDIHELAANHDNVIDSMNGTSQRIKLYRPKTFMPVFLDMVKVIHLAALEIEIAINGLDSLPKSREKIMNACVKLNSLENQADDLYHHVIQVLFEQEKDAIELIKKKDILENLEKCVDKAENVSDTIKTILIKIA
ncbi:MAG: DUF47 family protein [Bacteroidetes bacterium]|nr:DUF47 family protein [Bacteroidota bacterium]